MRIDSLVPGTEVTLDFGHYTETAKFLSLRGGGVERTASFKSTDTDGREYEWEAYRYQGHWVYGTSADRLRLVKVN